MREYRETLLTKNLLEFRDKVQWEKLTRPSPMEKMASEIAGATLLDQRNYMDELEHIISHERTYG